MDRREEIREFLSSRRAKLTPRDVGLQTYGGNRRVAGLRREEVALLAGVSAEYYIRLERGSLSGASDAVLEGLARALQLDEAERAHLFDLARAATGTPSRRRRAGPQRVRPQVQQVLDAIAAPAYIRNDRMDILAGNSLGLALLAPVVESHHAGANTARFMFLDSASQEFYLDWEKTANDSVAVLRGAAGRNPYDKVLQDLVGELSTRSEDFRRRWAAHDVRFHRTGSKRLGHPLVGELELTYEVFTLPADDGLTMAVYGAEPASPSADALSLLASWASTSEVRRAPADGTR